MPSSNSFDIVCEVDLQEVTNAVDQTQREIGNRYDFRGSRCIIDFDKSSHSLNITADDEYKMKTTIDILLTKMLKRSIPVKSLVYGKTEPTGKVLKKNIEVQQGLSKENCKQITQFIKKTKLKIQSQVSGDQVRVTGKNRDDLQNMIQQLKEQDFGFDMQFTNYR